MNLSSHYRVAAVLWLLRAAALDLRRSGHIGPPTTTWQHMLYIGGKWSTGDCIPAHTATTEYKPLPWGKGSNIVETRSVPMLTLVAVEHL